ncbi:MAG: efflux RND transporter periplasmic adaptor subunit [Proteobacteria bacterium]|nr:efflux RND transporter periplasmic adaptor subunit [Pseudomonadota bacterium]
MTELPPPAARPGLSRLRPLLAGAALALGLFCGSPRLAAQQPAAIPVGTVAAELRPITQAKEFVGRVDAVERVDIIARVTGFLQEVDFHEGDFVKAGDVLYRIERDTFEAAVQQARGALLQAQGNFANATAQRARTEELTKTDAASRALLDQRIAAEKAAQGDVVIADANLKTATVNLGYTTITAPISGKIGRSSVTKGNVVGPNTGILTTIVSVDPMYVTFPVSQREFLSIEKRSPSNDKNAPLTVRIRFSDDTAYPQTGKIDFVDVKVDRATDTVLVRATFPNPDDRLIDGQLVKVAVEAEKPVDKVLVPQTALIVDQQGPYVFVVADGKAAVQRVTIGGEYGPYAVIASGLKGGEQVVVQGMESLRPGAAVQASPVPPPAAGGT